MKRILSAILIVVMLFSIVNVSVVAANIATPKATASNDVGGIKVYWTAVSGAKKYNVYRRVGGSSSWVYAGTTTGTKIIDKGVSNGKYYVYSIRAYDSQNKYSAYNKNLTYTVKCVTTPKLTSLVNDTNGLKLTWSAVSGASYRVYRRGAGSTTWTYLGTVNSTTYTDTKATSGKYWRYTVRAVSSGYYSGFDTNGLYTMRLANPYSIKATQVQGGVNVTWAKINGATGYRVYRRGAGQTNWTYLGATTGNTFKDTKIASGTNYYRYTVRATRGNIYSYFYSTGSVVCCVTFEPITDPLVAVKMYERYYNDGNCCAVYNHLSGPNLKDKELEKYVPSDFKNYDLSYDIKEVLCDTCKTKTDVKNHVNFCIGDLKQDCFIADDCIFTHKGKLYFVVGTNKGSISYDLNTAEVYWIDDTTVKVAVSLDFDGYPYYDLFTIKLVNGSFKVIDVEEGIPL